LVNPPPGSSTPLVPARFFPPCAPLCSTPPRCLSSPWGLLSFLSLPFWVSPSTSFFGDPSVSGPPSRRRGFGLPFFPRPYVNGAPRGLLAKQAFPFPPPPFQNPVVPFSEKTYAFFAFAHTRASPHFCFFSSGWKRVCSGLSPVHPPPFVRKSAIAFSPWCKI